MLFVLLKYAFMIAILHIAARPPQSGPQSVPVSYVRPLNRPNSFLLSDRDE